MLTQKITHGVVAVLAALAMAGPAIATTIETEATIARSDITLFIGYRRGVELLRQVLPASAFVRMDTVFGQAGVMSNPAWQPSYLFGAAAPAVAASTSDTNLAALGPASASAGTAGDEGSVVLASAEMSSAPAGQMPEPSGALLLALGMTVTGAHLRRRKAR